MPIPNWAVALLLGRSPVKQFWYVKVRHVATGGEIQRLFANGATSKSEAELEMGRYLLRAGRAVTSRDPWNVVEVARWP